MPRGGGSAEPPNAAPLGRGSLLEGDAEQDEFAEQKSAALEGLVLSEVQGGTSHRNHQFFGHG